MSRRRLAPLVVVLALAGGAIGVAGAASGNAVNASPPPAKSKYELTSTAPDSAKEGAILAPMIIVAQRFGRAASRSAASQ